MKSPSSLPTTRPRNPSENSTTLPIFPGVVRAGGTGFSPYTLLKDPRDGTEPTWGGACDRGEDIEE